MKINLAKNSGFCFGVKRALNIAYQTAKIHDKVYILGDIVHNEDVVRQINKIGCRKITHLGKGKNKVLLIPSHGTSAKTYNKVKRRGYKIVDATCPMVKEIHLIALQAEQKGYKIIIIGDKRHDEVKGILGQLRNKALVIDNLKNIPIKKVKTIKKAAVVVQSTQNLKKVNAIVDNLKHHIRELNFFNTICNTTKVKQKELKEMSLENDAMIIIGSKNSANTKRLYEISKSLNKNSYWINSKNEIKPWWFKDVRSLGITAGASTPDVTTKTIINYIRRII